MTEGKDAKVVADRGSVQLVASLLNLEKRRLKPGCYDSCAKALDAVSRRVELMALIDNLFHAEAKTDHVACIRATETIATFLASSYALTERPRDTRGTCLLSLPETRGIALILNEIVDAYCRPNTNYCAATMSISVTNEPERIIIDLHLDPAAQNEMDISMLLIADLLAQHRAELSPEHVAGESEWRMVFPLGHQDEQI